MRSVVRERRLWASTAAATDTTGDALFFLVGRICCFVVDGVLERLCGDIDAESLFVFFLVLALSFGIGGIGGGSGGVRGCGRGLSIVGVVVSVVLGALAAGRGGR
jgi:hypothetical protein